MKFRLQSVLLATCVCFLLTTEPCHANHVTSIAAYADNPTREGIETGSLSILDATALEIENEKPASGIRLAKRKLSGLRKRKTTGLRKRKTTGIKKRRTTGIRKRKTSGIRKRNTSGLKGKYRRKR